MKLHHIGIHVEDLTKSEAFYGDILGFKKTGRIDTDSLAISFMSFDNSSIELICHKKDPKEADANSAVHLAFCSDDVDADFSRLTALGVTPESAEPVCFEGGKLFFFRGPDGETIEFMKDVNVEPV